MPYGKRRFSRKNRRYKFRRFSRGTRRISRIARRTIWRIAETKWINYAVTSVTQRTTYNMAGWTDSLPQGVGVSERIGRMIQCKRLSARIHLVFAEGAAGTGAWTQGVVRISVIFPRKSLGGITEMTSLISGQLFHSYWDSTNWFVKYDRYISMGIGDSNLISEKVFNISFPWHQKVEYLHAGTVQRKPILVFMSSIPDINTSAIVIHRNLRMSFKDI